jgi:hypothetical protein
MVTTFGPRQALPDALRLCARLRAAHTDEDAWCLLRQLFFFFFKHIFNIMILVQ